MVNKFGDDSVGSGGKRGPRGRIGEVGPGGKRGKAGESVGYYAQYFQHSKTKWDIDFEPNFWIDGYDIQKSPFKVLNRYEHIYDASPLNTSKIPAKGSDSVSGRHTLQFDGTECLTCPMNWNTPAQGSVDNLQIFAVLRFSVITSSGIQDGIFGNDNSGFDRFAALSNKTLFVGGAKDNADNSTFIIIDTFPKDANPIQTTKFYTLSVHWNNKGTGGCGINKSGVYCNGQLLKRFTAGDISGNTSFALGSLNCSGTYSIKGEIGRFLVCGSRDVPMNDDEIKNVHAYLMEEWKINEKPGAVGPRGAHGLKGDTGPIGPSGNTGLRGVRGLRGDAGIAGPVGPKGSVGPRGLKGDPGTHGVDVATKSFVQKTIQKYSTLNSEFEARLKESVSITTKELQILRNWVVIRTDGLTAQHLNGTFIVSRPGAITVEIVIKISKFVSVPWNATIGLYNETTAKVVDEAVLENKTEKDYTVGLYYRTTRKEEVLCLRVNCDQKAFITKKGSFVEVTPILHYEPPELITSGKVYPWESTVHNLNLNQSPEDYNWLHITGIKGEYTFISAMLCIPGMRTDVTVWDITSDGGQLRLVFTGEGHRVLTIICKDGYKVHSIYGQR